MLRKKHPEWREAMPCLQDKPPHEQEDSGSEVRNHCLLHLLWHQIWAIEGHSVHVPWLWFDSSPRWTDPTPCSAFFLGLHDWKAVPYFLDNFPCLNLVPYLHSSYSGLLVIPQTQVNFCLRASHLVFPLSEMFFHQLSTCLCSPP